MFPDKPGGISLYAHEGWRSTVQPVRSDRARSATGSGGRSCCRSSATSSAPSSSPSGSRGQATKVLLQPRGSPTSGCAQLIAVVRHPGRLGLQHARREALAARWATSRGAADDPARDLHRHALFHRGLACVEPRVRPRSAGFSDLIDRDHVAVHHVLVGLRDRGGRELRARVPRHQARHCQGAQERRGRSRFSSTCLLPLGLGGVVGSTGDYGSFYVAALRRSRAAHRRVRASSVSSRASSWP